MHQKCAWGRFALNNFCGITEPPYERVRLQVLGYTWSIPGKRNGTSARLEDPLRTQAVLRCCSDRDNKDLVDVVVVDGGVEHCVEIVEQGDNLQWSAQRRDRCEADDVAEVDGHLVVPLRVHLIAIIIIIIVISPDPPHRHHHHHRHQSGSTSSPSSSSSSSLRIHLIAIIIIIVITPGPPHRHHHHHHHHRHHSGSTEWPASRLCATVLCSYTPLFSNVKNLRLFIHSLFVTQRFLFCAQLVPATLLLLHQSAPRTHKESQASFLPTERCMCPKSEASANVLINSKVHEQFDMEYKKTCKLVTPL